MTPVDFIQNFQRILKEINISAERNAEKLHTTYRWIDNKDVRVTFFHLIGETAFTHGLTIYLIDTEILQNRNHWREKQKYFLPAREGVLKDFLHFIRLK